MSRKTSGDGKGGVFIAHAWVEPEDWTATVGPWHFWNVYQTLDSARQQAVTNARRSSWRPYGNWEVIYLSSEDAFAKAEVVDSDVNS